MTVFRFAPKMSALARACCVSFTLALAACSSPADKAEGYYRKGQALLEQGELVKARLEFQNAVQLKSSMAPAWYGLAEVAERQGDLLKAFNLLNTVIEHDPRHWQAQLKLGRLLLAAGQIDRALKASDAALALAPQEADVLALRAAVLYKLDDVKGALEQANAALARDAGNLDARLLLATERLAAGDGEAVLRFVDEGPEAAARNVVLQLVKIQALEKLGRLEAAEEVFRRLIGIYPENRSLRHVLARFYVAHGKPERAEAEYRAIVTENPTDAAARLDLARFVGTLRGPRAAREALQEMIARDPGANELKFALAGLHESMNEAEAGRAVLREIMSGAGDGADGLRAKGLLARSLLAAGERDAAGRLVAEVLAKDARNEEALLLNASMAIDARKLEQAIADLRTLLRDTPDSARAMLLLARAHDLAGSRELAEEHYVRAFQASRLAAPYGMAYAEYLLARGNAARAERVLDDVLTAAPGHEPALRLLAQARLAQGKWIGAAEVAEELRRVGDRGKVSNQILGAAYAGRQDFDASIAAFRRAHEAAPAETQTVAALVRSYMLAGKRAEAMNFVESVLKASPGNVEVRLLKGQLQSLQGDRQAAAQTFRAAIAADPRNPVPYRNLAGLLLDQQRFDEAAAVAAEGLAAVPGDFGLRLAQAASHELSGRYAEAIAAYEAMLADNPNADVVANNLASLLSDHRSDRSSFERAHELAQRFRRSDVPQFLDTLGWAKYRLGKYDEATSLLEAAAAKMPAQPVFRYHLGMNHLALGNKAGARKELEQVLAIVKDAPFPHADEVRAILRDL